jgi:hypothetical protein
MFGNLAQLVERNAAFTGKEALNTGRGDAEFRRKFVRRNAVIGTTPRNPFRIYRLYTFHNFAIISV